MGPVAAMVSVHCLSVLATCYKTAITETLRTKREGEVENGLLRLGSDASALSTAQKGNCFMKLVMLGAEALTSLVDDVY